MVRERGYRGSRNTFRPLPPAIAGGGLQHALAAPSDSC